MDIQVGSEASITAPSSGAVLFLNTDKGNALYYKLADGTVHLFVGSGDGGIDDIAIAWTEALACSLKKGIITAAQFEDIMNQGITVSKTSNTDDDGNTSSSISVGSRTIPIVSITLDASTFSGIATATHQIVTTFDPTNATNQTLTYITSNATKATVSNTGLITNVATGSAVITVIPNADPSKAKTVTVTVS